jgi:hypothetical protein
VVVALLGSLAVHLAVYLSLPTAVATFNPAKVVRYDASLVPIEQLKASAPPRRPNRPDAPLKRSVPEPSPTTQPAQPDTIGELPSAPNPDAVADKTTASAQAGNDNPSDAVSPATKPTEPTATAAAPEVPPVPEPTRAATAPAFAERISIEYKLTTAITDGIASFRWSRNGSRYEIDSSIQATGFLVGAFAGVIHQKSRGEITEDGLRPNLFSIRRGEGDAETAEFARASNTLLLRRNNVTRSAPLPRELQDMQSFLFQLAYDAPQIRNAGDKIDVTVTNARKVYRYQFRQIGIETLQTPFGAVETIRLLSAAQDPDDAYEVWLAPSYFYLPVRLKYFLGRFQVEQTATRMGVSAEPAPR